MLVEAEWDGGRRRNQKGEEGVYMGDDEGARGLSRLVNRVSRCERECEESLFYCSLT